MKDIVAVGNFVLEAVRTSDAATGALTSSAIPRDGEDGVGFSKRGNVKLFEREASAPADVAQRHIGPVIAQSSEEACYKCQGCGVATSGINWKKSS